MKKISIATSVVIAMLTACNNDNNNRSTDISTTNSNNSITVPATINYTITNAFPHDTTLYTEGLEWHDGALYESGGDWGKSKLVKTNLQDGKVLQQIKFLAKDFFGEGITVLNNKIYQLSYKNGLCTVYDFKTFAKLKEFTYDGEGWGMTNDGKQLIMNNGSDKLYYRNPETFKILNIVSVSDNNGPLGAINELEYVNGFIYSNVYTTNRIVKIDPASGKVVAQADFSGVIDKYAPGQISPEAQNQGAVLNGIAYDSTGKRFFITGKLWPKMFEVKM